ncbi:MAG: DUF2752 domain-containing protein [Planctomycetota bacterium]|nr:DUF2752 domain-containing protein [Planctomycetota bacterium]
MSEPLTTESGPVNKPVDYEALRRNHHRNVLILCTTVVILALTLQTRADQRVEFMWLPGVPMPESCASRSIFDVECPGCGLTRSFIAIARGSLSAAFQQNRTGWLLACGLLIQFPYRVWMLFHVRTRGLPEPVPERLKLAFVWILIVALVGNWLLKILGI